MSTTKKKTEPVDNKTTPESKAPAKPVAKPAVLTKTDLQTMRGVIDLASKGGVIVPGNDQIVVGHLTNRIDAILASLEPPVEANEVATEK